MLWGYSWPHVRPVKIRTLHILASESSILWSYLVHFLGPSSKNKKIQLEKNSLYFGKWNFLALILKNFLIFLIFWEMETPKKISYISGNENPKKRLIFRKWNFSAQSWKTKKPIPEKDPYISGNGTFWL